MRYSYVCAKCGSSVSKPPVGADKEGKMLHGLHGWKCPVDGPTSVKRTLNHPEKS
jgi:DNA-directed RNA polymerase subunit RPC12/RpoP